MAVYITDESEKILEDSMKERLSHIVRDVIDGAVEYVNCPYECTVEVTFTDNASIREINLEQRKIDAPTDVLSFPLLEYNTPGDFSFLEDAGVDAFDPETGELLLGDIVISLERAKEQAAEYGHSIFRETAFLTAHSMLHLFGYDHIEDGDRVTMEQMQEDILQRKGYTRDYE